MLPPHNLSKQKGAALLMVLMVLAVVSVLAANSGEQVRYLMKRAENVQLLEQAYWYGLGGEELAREVLMRDVSQSYTHLKQDWATQGAVFPIDGGSLKGEIQDLNHCFNLNALREGDAREKEVPLAHQVFTALIKALDIPEYNAEILRQRIKDWIDADAAVTGHQGLEFGYYTDKGVPYSVPNQLMVDRTELYLLNTGVEELEQKVMPFLCALPNELLEINVNTLQENDAPLLVALTLGKVELEKAQSIIQQRPESGFTSLDDFWESTDLEEISAEIKKLAVLQSFYFRSDVQVNYFDVVHFVHSWFKRTDKGFNVYARQYGEKL